MFLLIGWAVVTSGQSAKRSPHVVDSIGNIYGAPPTVREIWEAAEKRMLSGPVNRNYKGDFLSTNPSFHEFLESKGIKI
jgi:hypothetical protein